MAYIKEDLSSVIGRGSGGRFKKTKHSLKEFGIKASLLIKSIMSFRRKTLTRYTGHGE